MFWLIFGRLKYPNAALKISLLCLILIFRKTRCVTESTYCIFFKRQYNVTILLEESWMVSPTNVAVTQSMDMDIITASFEGICFVDLFQF